jgi:hypothetical protein
MLPFLAVSAHAITCQKSVAFLASAPGSGKEVPRPDLLKQISGLYQAALNDRVSMETVLFKMRELADREGTGIETIRKEVERLSVSPSELQQTAEERREQRAQEHSLLFEGLRPYLERLSDEHRTIIETELILPGVIKPLITGEVEFIFKGQHHFVMGTEMSQSGGSDRTQPVSFSPGNDFAIGQVPVTQFLYFLAALNVDGVEPTPSEFKKGEGSVVLRLGDKKFRFKPNHPVEQVSHYDSLSHARRVSTIMGIPYQLPTDQQWEFANRAGSAERYHFGNDVAQLPHYAWFSENAGMQTHAVGEKLPNAFHLYDTHGNVQEWNGPEKYEFGVFRGGSWEEEAGELRSSTLHYDESKNRRRFRGFRLVRQVPGRVRPSHSIVFGESQPKLNPHSGNIEGGK